MSTHKQGKGNRGSLKWIQRLINGRPDIIDREIARLLRLKASDTVEWVSPRSPDYAEYRDTDFLKAIHHPEYAADLKEFWPRNGPQWDALGMVSSGTVIIVEAKAHVAEVFTIVEAKDPKSRAKIEATFHRTQTDLGIDSPYPWVAPFYQYANRVAHLHFLNNLCGVPTVLAFVHFLGDEDMDGPRRRPVWKETNRKIHKYLGLAGRPIQKRIIDVFVEVDDLK